MMIQTTVKCPNCKKKVSQLEFWKEVDGKYFHLCKKCFEKALLHGLQTDNLLRVGFQHGYEQAKQDMKKKVNEL